MLLGEGPLLLSSMTGSVTRGSLGVATGLPGPAGALSVGAKRGTRLGTRESAVECTCVHCMMKELPVVVASEGA